MLAQDQKVGGSSPSERASEKGPRFEGAFSFPPKKRIWRFAASRFSPLAQAKFTVSHS